MGSGETTRFGGNRESSLRFTFLDLDLEGEGDDQRFVARDPSAEWDLDLTRVGTRFGDYEVIGTLGEGAMSVVLRGRHVQTGKEVAIKLLQEKLEKNKTVRERFRREAAAVAGLRHHNVIDAYLYGVAFQQPFMVLELLEGGTLGDELKRCEQKGIQIPVERVIEVMCQVLSGLEAAHDRAMLHRDIKPDNLLVDKDGQIKIADFGLVKLLSDASQQQLTVAGATLGTPLYMGPEQLMGDPLDGRADLYSVGITLYELLTGTVPLQAASMMALYDVRSDEPPPPPSSLRGDVPAALDAVAIRLLEPAAADRFQSARDARLALEAASPAPFAGRSVTVKLETPKESHSAVLQPGEAVVMGRSSSSADFAIGDSRLSRRHCLVRLTPRGLVVEDLGSTNGSFLKGTRLAGSQVIPSGAELEIGDTRVRVNWAPLS